MSFSAHTTPSNPPTPKPPLVASIMASAGLPAVNLAASFAGSANLSASLSIDPPNIEAILEGLGATAAHFNFALGFGCPNISFDASASLKLVADLEAALALLIEVEALLALPVGIPWLTYNGPGVGLGTVAGANPVLAPVKNAIIIGAVDIPLLTSPSAQVKGLLSGLHFSDELLGFSTGVLTNFGDMSPVTLGAMGKAEAAIKSQLDVALKIAAHPTITPPSLAVSAAAALRFAAYLKTISILDVLPKVHFALDASLALNASIKATVGQALLDLGLALLPNGSFFVYTWSGAGGTSLGLDLTTELLSTWGDNHTPTALPAVCAILGAADPVSAGALYTTPLGFFGGVA